MCIAGGFIALFVARRFADRLLDGDLASFWMVWYGGVRLFLEAFRDGWNWTVLGVPVAMLIGAGALALLGVMMGVVQAVLLYPLEQMAVRLGLIDRLKPYVTRYSGRSFAMRGLMTTTP